MACRCGAVAIEATGEPFAQFYCHCDDCQALHGAAYVPEAVYEADAVTVVQGNPVLWTLKHNPRAFCGVCGTRLFVDVLRYKIRGVNGALFEAGQFKPQFHVQCRYALHPVQDALPHYEGMPSRFGGCDTTVDW